MRSPLLAVAVLAPVLSLGCGSSPEPPARSAQNEVKTYLHDLRHVQHDCVDAGMCVAYSLWWPAHSRVALELHTDGFLGVLSVQRGPAPAERFEPGADGVIRAGFETANEPANVQILVAGKTLKDRGPTRLVVVGPPAKEIQLPTPPPREAALEADRSKDAQEKRDELALVYAKETAGFTREPSVETGDLATPKDLTVSLRRGRCYKVFLSLEDTGQALAWSPRLDAKWRGMSTSVGISPVTQKSGLGSASTALCPTSDGSAKVLWSRPDLAKSQLKGPYKMEVWTRTLSANELKGVDAKEHGLFEDIGARGCNVCRDNTKACLSRSGSGCMDRFQACLQENSVPANRCHY